MNKQAIFLDGPIGSGKTTLGRALAVRLDAHFIDGDDHSDPGRPWYASSLSTSRAIVRATVAALETHSRVVIAYPLRHRQWFFYQRTLCQVGIRADCIGLRAAYPAIVARHRQRTYSHAEHRRIQTMIAEGYGQRSFSAVIVDTDQADFLSILVSLESQVLRLTYQRCGCQEIESDSATPAIALVKP